MKDTCYLKNASEWHGKENEEEYEEELEFDKMCDLEVTEISGSGFSSFVTERPFDPLAATLFSKIDDTILPW